MNPWNDTALSVDERTDALLADLTLEEKVAQLGSFWPMLAAMTGVAVDDVAPMQSAFGLPSPLEEVARHGLGHITRAFGSAPVEVDEGVRRLIEEQQTVIASSPHDIPAIIHEECLTGFTTWGATVYPAAIAWGATWNPGLVEEMAHAIGTDMRAVGVHQGLSPLLDVVRDYRWGRVEETCGEDPYLVGTLGTAYVRGLQDAGVLATLKHFAGYSASKAARNHAPVPMGRREFEDVLLPSFEMAVREGGVGSVMNSYSDIDGVPAGASVELLTTTLRDRWGFTGTVVSDYGTVSFLRIMHKIAADNAEAARLALTAGLDIELPGAVCYPTLTESVQEGLLDEALVDRSARRVLRQKIELGLLDPDYDVTTDAQVSDLDHAANREIARRMADETVVLCANESGVLPLQASSIALIGPCGAESRTFLGCYSYPNHVMAHYPDLGIGLDITNLADAMRSEFAEAAITVEQGVPILEPDRSGIEAAVAAAREAEVAVVAVGDLAGLFGHGTSGEGCDSVDLSLPGLQAELVQAVLETGTPTVLVVVSGRPYSLGAFARHENCAAIVQAFMPGCEGGQAIAGVLSGRINPTGHLPIAVPDHPGGQPGTYLAPPLGWWSEGVSNLDPRPLFAFGHGLGYTTYQVSDLELSASSIAPDGSLEVSVTVANTGERDGAEVVQLYLNDVVGQVTRPIIELVGYAKVPLTAGESKRVTFTLHADRTSFTGIAYRRIVEPGEFIVRVGTSSVDLPLEASFQITGDVREVGEGRVLTTPVRIESRRVDRLPDPTTTASR